MKKTMKHFFTDLIYLKNAFLLKNSKLRSLPTHFQFPMKVISSVFDGMHLAVNELKIPNSS